MSILFEYVIFPNVLVKKMNSNRVLTVLDLWITTIIRGMRSISKKQYKIPK